MKTYTLQHFFRGERPKLVGLFSTRERAQEAAAQLAEKPGFKKAPKFIESLETQDASGFAILRFVVDEQLFKTVTPKARIKKEHRLYLLEHHKSLPDGTLADTILAVISCEKEAKHLAIKLKNRPEYAGAQELLPPGTIGNGFVITPITLDELDWAEGFTIPYDD